MVNLTDGEQVDIDSELELFDENGYAIDNENYYYYMNHNKYDLRKITKQIRSKKFICEAPMGSSKSTAIHKLFFFRIKQINL